MSVDMLLDSDPAQIQTLFIEDKPCHAEATETEPQTCHEHECFHCASSSAIITLDLLLNSSANRTQENASLTARINCFDPDGLYHPPIIS